MRADEPVETPSSSPRETASEVARPHVLLVDEQPARLLTYESVLEGVGVQCVRARSGQEALARLSRHSFALVLLDVSMPGMDRYETARAMRQHPKFEHTPILFVTGVHPSELDTLRGYEAGATGSAGLATSGFLTSGFALSSFAPSAGPLWRSAALGSTYCEGVGLDAAAKSGGGRTLPERR